MRRATAYMQPHRSTSEAFAYLALYGKRSDFQLSIVEPDNDIGAMPRWLLLMVCRLGQELSAGALAASATISQIRKLLG